MSHRLLVTGGAGFIGSNFVRRILNADPRVEVIVVDKLTYAGNRANLADLERCSRFRFEVGDIADDRRIGRLVSGVDAIVNFAAESHVDRSIEAPRAFLETAVIGTYVLLEAARQHGRRFLQISTDEVYGDVPQGLSREDDPVRPRSPYSASKAASDLLALAYHATYGLPAMVTRATNTFGPYQYPEKVIPLFVTNAIDDLPLPVYGDGHQVRDWLSVEDHCDAIIAVLDRGTPGETYNIGAGNTLTNLELTRLILDRLAKPMSLIRHVADREGHDRRYAVDASKISGLGWKPVHPLREALTSTVDWYRLHESWWRPLKDPKFLAYYQRQYAGRLAAPAVRQP